MIRRAAEHHEVMAVIGKPKPTNKPKKKTISIDKADYYFSICVRERSNWTCQKCGRQYPPTYNNNGLPGNQALHCSHFVGRGNKAVRFDPENVEAHCYGCHSMFEANPHIFTEYMENKLGKRYNSLIKRSLDIELGKRMYQERAEIAEHYKNEYARLVEKRSAGENGYLEITAYCKTSKA